MCYYVHSGRLVFTEEELNKVVESGQKAILVVNAIEPCLGGTDAISLLALVHKSDGLLISHGHLNTCAAAIQARDTGKCAVSFTEKVHCVQHELMH